MFGQLQVPSVQLNLTEYLPKQIAKSQFALSLVDPSERAKQQNQNPFFGIKTICCNRKGPVVTHCCCCYLVGI